MMSGFMFVMGVLAGATAAFLLVGMLAAAGHSDRWLEQRGD